MPKSANISVEDKRMSSERPMSHESNDVLQRLRIRSSIDDIRSPYFWRALFAELLGTLLLVFIGLASTLPGTTVTRISLCFGLAVATIVWATAHVSGGHINPAVTLGMLITRRISLIRGGLYIVSQLAGATAGAALIYALTPEVMNNVKTGAFGVNMPGNNVTPVNAFVIEAIVTFVLVFVVFSTVDSKRDDLNGSGPLAIGLTVAVCHLSVVPLSGSSMNPARSFGPAVVKGIYTAHWVYWAGPLLGGIVAALLYEYVFAANASLSRSRACLLASKYDGSDSVSKAEKIHEKDVALEIMD